MNGGQWLVLGLASVAAALSVACSDFSSCQARRLCPHGGAGGDAGVGEAGSEGVSKAGTAGISSGASGSDEGGSADEGSAPGEFPALFDACTVKGMFTCAGHASAQRLACDGKLWQAGTTCAANELCDSSDGTCLPIVTECASAKPGAIVCRKDSPVKCGPDLLTETVAAPCAGVCKFGVCQSPICGDEKIEQGEDCDDAEGNASGACAKCKTATCGDGVVYVGHEQCDDGNKVSGDGCSATCRAEPVELALGSDLTCARSSTGLVKCWGYNGTGSLGLGDTINRGDRPNSVPSKLPAIDLGTGRTAKAISARGGSVCALLDNGDLKCWGNNFSGQLGTGDKDHRGDGPGEMGDALKPIPLGVAQEVIGISTGISHTCVVFEGGGVKCWGSAEDGQLGQENKADALSPGALPPIKLARPATGVSASNYLFDGKGGPNGGSTCALLDNGAVLCWGATAGVPHTDSSDVDSSYGIGDSALEMSALPPLTFSGGSPAKSIVAGAVSAALLADGSLRLWGSGPQLGQPALGSNDVGLSPDGLKGLEALDTGGKKVKSIAVGKRHACAVLDGGVLKCWGDGSYGQLGLGATESTNAAPRNLLSVNLGGQAALQVATGESHTCAIIADGTLRCWGFNENGQLGLGDADNRLMPDTTVDLSF